MPYKNIKRQRQYQLDWVNKRRRTWFAKNGPCQHCGCNQNLELHHPNRTDKVEHKVWSWTQARRTAELDKCVVLCKACHLEITKWQLTKPIQHGTHNAYASGCRCDQCRNGHRLYDRAYHVRKKSGPRQ